MWKKILVVTILIFLITATWLSRWCDVNLDVPNSTQVESSLDNQLTSIPIEDVQTREPDFVFLAHLPSGDAKSERKKIIKLLSENGISPYIFTSKGARLFVRQDNAEVALQLLRDAVLSGTVSDVVFASDHKKMND